MVKDESRKHEIAQKIKNCRIDSGLTQLQVAEKLGVTYQAVSNYERGKNSIEADILLAMCEIYGADPIEILRRDSESNDRIQDGAKERQPAKKGKLSDETAHMIKLFREVPEDQRALAAELVESVLLALIKHRPVQTESQAAAPAGSDRQ